MVRLLSLIPADCGPEIADASRRWCPGPSTVWTTGSYSIGNSPRKHPLSVSFGRPIFAHQTLKWGTYEEVAGVLLMGRPTSVGGRLRLADSGGSLLSVGRVLFATAAMAAAAACSARAAAARARRAAAP